jgi:hypothetical protein
MQAFEEASDKAHKEFKEPSQQANKHDAYIRHDKQASRLKKLVVVMSAILLLALGLGLGLGLGFGLDKGAKEGSQSSSADQLLFNTTGELASAKAAVTTTGALG